MPFSLGTHDIITDNWLEVCQTLECAACIIFGQVSGVFYYCVFHHHPLIKPQFCNQRPETVCAQMQEGDPH